jgi:glutamate N-acetyltransferase/amino-acid N-acetyltransferase
MAPGTQVGGVFTTSKTAAAPVEWCRAALAQKSARMLVVNSGNANAFTGKAGVDSVRTTAESAAATRGAATRRSCSSPICNWPKPVEPHGIHFVRLQRATSSNRSRLALKN